MFSRIAEAGYPVSFRKDDTKILSDFLNRRDSVDLIGLRRIGISNFLRFFLYNPSVSREYMRPSTKHLFIPVDLNDLIERELYPFWVLTLKRIVDAVGDSSLRGEVKQKIESLFVSSMQQADLFLLIDTIRNALVEIGRADTYPTLFFIRFDRIKDVIHPTFFDNLQGLKDATNHQVAFVFTSFRSIEELSPAVFPRADAAGFFQKMYIRPVSDEDMKILFTTQQKRYGKILPQNVKQELFRLVAGSAQYLQLALIVLHETTERVTGDSLQRILMRDERIQLHSEELWESLTKEEKHVLRKVAMGEKVNADERESASYLWDSGMVAGKQQLFSPLLSLHLLAMIKEVVDEEVHFSKKENKLFNHLRTHLQQICEREAIITAVWPEYSEFGISDWAIDRLVARVRAKLKKQESLYEIQTVRTRGYKMIEKS